MEIASWRLAAEMTRRHPTIRVIETHPCGGLYDCFELNWSADQSSFKPHIALHRVGSIHWFGEGSHDGQLDSSWEIYLGSEDPRAFVSELGAKAGLLAVSKPPATTPRVLVYRFIAAFLSQTVLGRDMWECRSGYCDSSSASGSYVRSEWFDSFSHARDRLRNDLSDDFLAQPAYRFWFICQGNAPKLCLETTGMAWDLEGNEFDLMKLYRVRHRVLPVVSFVARDLLL